MKLKITLLVGLAFLSLAPQVAISCVAPNPPYETAERIEGLQCSIKEHRAGSNLQFFASEAEDEGNGIISQLLGQHNGCFGETLYMVADCSSSEVSVVGDDQDSGDRYEISWGDTSETYASFERDNGRDYAVLLSLRQYGVSPYDVTPNLLMSVAKRLNFEMQQAYSTADVIRYDEYRMELGCACALFYPDSAGATQ